MTNTFYGYGITHPGRLGTRERNEDYIGTCEFFVNNERVNVFVVADGIGGENAGEIASKLAVESILSYFKRAELLDPLQDIIDSIVIANQEILDSAKSDNRRHGMGCVVSVVLIYRNVAYYGHIGDTKILLKSAMGKTIQITGDHVHQGTLIRSLGEIDNINVETRKFSLEKTDTLIICSDGLTSSITEHNISALINLYKKIDQLCFNLVKSAVLSIENNDNVSCIVIASTDSATATTTALPETLDGCFPEQNHQCVFYKRATISKVKTKPALVSNIESTHIVDGLRKINTRRSKVKSLIIILIIALCIPLFFTLLKYTLRDKREMPEYPINDSIKPFDSTQYPDINDRSKVSIDSIPDNSLNLGWSADKSMYSFQVFDKISKTPISTNLIKLKKQLNSNVSSNVSYVTNKNIIRVLFERDTLSEASAIYNFDSDYFKVGSSDLLEVRFGSNQFVKFQDANIKDHKLYLERSTWAWVTISPFSVKDYIIEVKGATKIGDKYYWYDKFNSENSIKITLSQPYEILYGSGKEYSISSLKGNSVKVILRKESETSQVKALLRGKISSNILSMLYGDKIPKELIYQLFSALPKINSSEFDKKLNSILRYLESSKQLELTSDISLKLKREIVDRADSDNKNVLKNLWERKYKYSYRIVDGIANQVIYAGEYTINGIDKKGHEISINEILKSCNIKNYRKIYRNERVIEFGDSIDTDIIVYPLYYQIIIFPELKKGGINNWESIVENDSYFTVLDTLAGTIYIASDEDTAIIKLDVLLDESYGFFFKNKYITKSKLKRFDVKSIDSSAVEIYFLKFDKMRNIEDSKEDYIYHYNEILQDTLKIICVSDTSQESNNNNDKTLISMAIDVLKYICNQENDVWNSNAGTVDYCNLIGNLSKTYMKNNLFKEIYQDNVDCIDRICQ